MTGKPAPKDETTLGRWARHLGLTPATQVWQDFRNEKPYKDLIFLVQNVGNEEER